VFTLGNGIAAEEIDRAAFGGRGEPCAWVFGDSGSRPLFECGDECFLREVFGQADVAGQACESGDDACGLTRQTASMLRCRAPASIRGCKSG